MRLWVPLALLLSATSLCSGPEMAVPRYTTDGALRRPDGYRHWLFVGASIGMGYSESETASADKAPQQFHNIYIQPEAYRHFAAKGRFPDKTVLVMEVLSAGGNASINKQGRFEDRHLGIEAAVKDVARFPEEWAYFSFIGSAGEPLAAAKPFPKEACWSCHHQHGAADNVFVQFYPVLREARENAPK
jgi:hypothetical protein